MARPITPSVLYRTIFLAFALVVAGLIFRQLSTLLLGVMIVVIVALPISAVATWLQRIKVPRPVGAVIGLLILLGVLGGLIAALVPVFSHEIKGFTSSLPSIVDELRHRLGRLTGTSPSHVGQQIQHFIDNYTNHPTKLLGPLADIGAGVVAIIAALIVGLLTALYAAINPDPLVGGLTRMVPPPRRPQAAEIISRLRVAYLGWLRGLCIGMVLLGGMTYVGLLLIGLPFAAFFAIFTALAMIVPYWGALVSSIPPILYALTLSPGKAVLVAALYIGAHQVEGNLLQPLVVARTVELHPAVVAVGVLAVQQLFGFIGLFIAVPVLATIKILLEELWIKPNEDRAREQEVAAEEVLAGPEGRPQPPPTSPFSRGLPDDAPEEQDITPAPGATHGAPTGREHVHRGDRGRESSDRVRPRTARHTAQRT